MFRFVINLSCGFFVFLNLLAIILGVSMPWIFVIIQFVLLIAVFVQIMRRPRYRLLTLFGVFSFVIVFSPLFLNIIAGQFYVKEWRGSVDFFLGNNERVSFLYSIAYLSIFSFILGINQRRDIDFKPLSPTNLSISTFSVAVVVCILVKYFIAPKGFILSYSYTYLRTTSLIEDNTAIGIVEYLIAVILCFLFFDAITDVQKRRKKTKMISVLISIFIINIVLELLKGERTTVGLFPAILFIHLAYNYKSFDKRFKWSIFLGCILFFAFLSLGVLRSGTSSSTDIAFSYLFQSGTWLGAFYSIIGSAEDYLGGVDLKFGTTYIDYLRSIPPGFLASYLNYVRPNDTIQGNPAMWYYGAYTHGGLSPIVAALLNFGVVGLVFFNFGYGYIVNVVERKFFEKGTLFAFIMYFSMSVFLLRWFWYGDIYLIRLIMTAMLVYLIVRFLFINNRTLRIRRHAISSLSFLIGCLILPSCVDAKQDEYKEVVSDRRMESSLESREQQYIINVMDFGAKGNGVHDDSKAIQAAIDFARSRRYSTNRIEDVYSGSYFGGSPKIYFPFGRYLISRSIKFYSYINIEADKAILFPSPSFKESTDFALSGIGWQTTIEGLQFIGFKKAIEIKTDNVNSGMIVIENCDFYENNVSIDLDARSALSIIKECRFIKNRKVLIQERGDKVIFQDNWIWAGTLRGKSDSQVDVKWGVLHFVNNLLVPSPPAEGAVEPAWINNYGSVIASGIRQGAEAGSFTLINNFSTGDPKFAHSKVVIVENSSCYAVYGNTRSYTTPAVLRLYNVPNQILIKGITGMIRSTVVDFAKETKSGVQSRSLKSLSNKHFTISVENIVGEYKLLPNGKLIPSQLESIISE